MNLSSRVSELEKRVSHIEGEHTKTVDSLMSVIQNLYREIVE